MNTSRRVSLPDALERLGLTSLEAEVYQFLLAESPASGYRIAQAIGRPVSNVYKAIDALADKGAALTSDDEGTRVARAVDPGEFAARRHQEFEQACTVLVESRSAPAAAPPDDRLYRLTSTEQSLARVRGMLAAARTFVIATITPPILELLKSDLIATAARGVNVAVKSFAPVDLPGVRVQVDPRGEAAVESGPGHWIGLTIDGAELLHALFDAVSLDLHMGAWTSHPLITWLSYTGLSSDFALASVRQNLSRGADIALSELAALSAFESPESTGKMHLISRYRRPARGHSGRRRAHE
jgi:HTH-type transcriptional regulator, sugar sensing transcriptional regulator